MVLKLIMTEEKSPPSEPIVFVSQKPMARDSFLEAAQQQAFLFYKLGVSLFFGFVN